MMTYRSLKTFVNKNTQSHNDHIFDLIPSCVKSKIILVVGDDASNTAAFLCSIMHSCEIDHFHFVNDGTDICKQFIQNKEFISKDAICENAEKILKAAKKVLSNNDLFFFIALSLCQNEYAVLEIDKEYYTKIQGHISPFALILAINDDKLVQSYIENTSYGVNEIVALSQNDNFDYISNKYNKNGARITLASPNKIILANSNLLGTSFYHYSYLYHISSFDLNNVPLAHLAIEASSILFSSPRPYIYKGLESAKIPRDLVVYSLSPAIILCEDKNDFKLHHRLKFNKVSESDEIKYPTENTIFCGNKTYIEKIKRKLEKR